MTGYNTTMLEPENRFPFWWEMSSRAHVRCWIRSEHERDFVASVRSLTFGGLVVTALTYPSLQVERTPKLIRQDDPEVFQLNLLTQGRGGIEHRDRRVTLSGGDFVLCDSSYPLQGWRSAVGSHASALLVQIPRRWLPFSGEAIDRLVGRPFSSAKGGAALLAEHLATLIARGEECADADEAALADAVMALILVACSQRAAVPAPLSPEARKRVQLKQMKRFMLQRLSDPGLSPATVAVAHGISLRQLQKSFQAEGVGVSAWIRRKRLERCRRDLADPLLADRPIHAIAARWGIVDGPHFSRLFKSAFGVTPGEYRKVVAIGPDCADIQE
ncbi:helix-turn-helix domain-containing protein [Spongiactinospora sp. TRM90649]|uniref:AraC-like ligand-binding domain-containing protein n=1 Tax=Spongiactinospora sp. TRM90649 TaxID=3031114 RepID=UPI0023F96F81|nr:helix-turn-helix domain-containing protein [Spongiactinospora sp. TRM90649]MDF5757514.1 helix-turn-helix domain-containing protein [Spongiactinospora sp. TRM90649]